MVLGKLTALAAAAIVALGASFSASDKNLDAEFIVFNLWIISPYWLFLGISWLIERGTTAFGRYGISCIVASIMLAFSVLVYVGTDDGQSATYGLIFIFAPLWLHIGGLGLFGVLLFFAWLGKAPASTAS